MKKNNLTDLKKGHYIDYRKKDERQQTKSIPPRYYGHH